MTRANSYHQFCPVAMAAEIVCTRWTVLVLREMFAGSTRFNELRRGVPRMSPALLSKRLRELQSAGIVERRAGEGGAVYRLTRAGSELRGVVTALGAWGQRWVESSVSLDNLDPSLLMWDMRRNLDPSPLPDRRCVVHFRYPALAPAQREWWLVIDGDVDLCSIDPGFDVDLCVVADLRAMTAIWMGLTSVDAEVRARRVQLSGDAALKRSMQRWLGLSPFAKERKRAA